MQITIKIENKLSDPSSHLKRNLFKKLERLGAKIILDSPSIQEWQVLKATVDGEANDFENKVDLLFFEPRIKP